MPDFTYELNPAPGLFSDDTTFSAKGRWADGNNVRFWHDKPEKIGRVVRILGSGSVAAAPNPRTVFAFSGATSLAAPAISIGTDAALYSSGGSLIGLTDVTPAGLGTGITYWAFDAWGATMLVAPKGGSLYVYNPATPPATIISQAPAQMSHMLVTAQRQVMALGCNEEVSTTFNPMCVRWCDLENYTTWATTATNNAGEHILEGQGKIVAGRRIGPYIAIWTDGMLFLASFVGDPKQTFNFERVSGGCGLVGPGAVAEIRGVLYWMTPDHRFYSWSPGSPPAQVPCPIGLELQANLLTGVTHPDQRTTAAAQPAFNEVWWFYPDLRDVATSGYRYVALNVVDGAWFRGQLDRRAAYHADFLYTPTGGGFTRGWRPFITVDGDGKIYSHEVESFGGSGDGAVAIDWFIQSADQYLNSGRTRVMVKGAVPDFETQTDAINLTVYMRDRPQSTAVTKGPYSLATTATKKDFRASGMLMSVKLSGTGTGNDLFRLGKPAFPCVTLGGR